MNILNNIRTTAFQAESKMFYTDRQVMSCIYLSVKVKVYIFNNDTYNT